ncbi:MAG: LysR family transcriptional regulator [Dehalococcoidia bacterium]|nr:LysR family transcriptional regulator [Dehalococcoidia bacterium]
MEDFVPRQKLWLERDGRLVMSDYRVRLLELVAETGSLAQAATVMGLSYRRAWGKLKEIEANIGLELVHSAVGGAGGGHTGLTPAGHALVAAYRRFQARLAEDLARAFAEELAAVVEGGAGGAPPPAAPATG